MDPEELKQAYATLKAMREELLDEATSGNLERTHHLESAVAAFESIGKILEVQTMLMDWYETLTDLEHNESVGEAQDDIMDRYPDAIPPRP